LTNTVPLQFASSSCAETLNSLRAKTAGTKRLTEGLSLDLLKPFNEDPLLNKALKEAHSQFDVLVKKYGPGFVVRDEAVLSEEMQKGFVNFYGISIFGLVLAHVSLLTHRFASDPGALIPYIPLAARGPWIVTLHGAVVHDNGGYGTRAAICVTFSA
jgi:hypothetical protein